MSQYGEGDSCPVLDETWRTSRKDRKCDACKEAIRTGHRYHRTASLYDGSWNVTERCERCQFIFEHLSDCIAKEGDREEYEYCHPDLNCGHEYKERWKEEPPPEIAALAFWRPGDPLPISRKAVGG